MIPAWKFLAAIIVCAAMLAFIFGMAFIPDNTHQWGSI